MRVRMSGVGMAKSVGSYPFCSRMDVALMSFVIESREGIGMGDFCSAKDEIDMKFGGPLTVAMNCFRPQFVLLGDSQPS